MPNVSSTAPCRRSALPAFGLVLALAFLWSFPAIGEAAAPAELLANPSFASSPSGWRPVGARVERGRGGDGRYVLRVRSSRLAAFGILSAAQRATSMRRGARLVAAVSVRAASPRSVGGSVFLVIRERRGGRTVLEHKVATTLRTKFTTLTTRQVARSTGSSIEMLVIQGGTAPGRAFEIGDASLTSSPPLLPSKRPTASFTATPATLTVGERVDLSDTSVDVDGSIASRAWDLDDDGAYDDGSGRRASTSFSTPGRHAVRVRVVDDRGGASTATRTLTVGSSKAASLVRVTANSLAPVVGEEVLFTDRSADPVRLGESRQWDLDDDGAFDDASGATATHMFSVARPATVRLRVLDSRGSVSNAALELDVKPSLTAGLPSGNLISNASFESGAAGWRSASADLARVGPPGVPHGRFALRFAPRGGATSVEVDDAPASVPRAEPGATYRAVAYARAADASAVGRPMTLGLREAGGTGMTMLSSASLALSARFQRIEIVRVATTGEELDLVISHDSGTRSAGVLVDAVSLTQIAPPPRAPTRPPTATPPVIAPAPPPATSPPPTGTGARFDGSVDGLAAGTSAQNGSALGPWASASIAGPSASISVDGGQLAPPRFAGVKTIRFSLPSAVQRAELQSVSERTTAGQRDPARTQANGQTQYLSFSIYARSVPQTGSWGWLPIQGKSLISNTHPAGLSPQVSLINTGQGSGLQLRTIGGEATSRVARSTPAIAQIQAGTWYDIILGTRAEVASTGWAKVWIVPKGTAMPSQSSPSAQLLDVSTNYSDNGRVEPIIWRQGLYHATASGGRDLDVIMAPLARYDTFERARAYFSR